jgi:hypothetical protein
MAATNKCLARSNKSPMGARVPGVCLQETNPALPTKDGGTLRTVGEARAYMLGLSKDRELRAQWQYAAELLLAETEVANFSKQVELALFYDAKLDVAAMK